ncbi:MAG: PilZ domain-containing protein [Deltaproteobacteria bacterium]
MLRDDVMEERRKFSRLDISVGVAWRRLGETMSQGVGDIDATRNIAEGGVCLVANEQFDVGDRMELTLTLPSNKTIRTLGEVVWVHEAVLRRDDGLRRYDIGVTFLDLPETEWQEMKQFLYSFP